MEKTFRLSPKDMLYLTDKDSFYVVAYLCDGLYFTVRDIQDMSFPTENEFMQDLDKDKGVLLLWTPYEMQKEFIWVNLLKMPFAWHAKEVNLGFGVYVAYVLKSNTFDKKIGDYLYVSTNEDLTKIPEDFETHFAYSYPLIPNKIVYYTTDVPVFGKDSRRRYKRVELEKEESQQSFTDSIREIIRKEAEKGEKS